MGIFYAHASGDRLPDAEDSNIRRDLEADILPQCFGGGLC